MEVFGTVDDFLFEFYWNEMQYIESQLWHFKFISTAMSIYICEFLCSPQHNYRIECIFDDEKNLFSNQVWVYDIDYTYREIKIGKDTLDIQFFDGSGYSCDICRAEISRYDWMYHCTAEHSHDYCLSYLLFTKSLIVVQSWTSRGPLGSHLKNGNQWFFDHFVHFGTPRTRL